MKLENLPKSKETKVSKRVGRGPGSGMGKTATRGETVKNQEVVHQFLHGSKVDKLHFIEESQSEDLIIKILQLNLL